MGAGDEVDLVDWIDGAGMPRLRGGDLGGEFGAEGALDDVGGDVGGAEVDFALGSIV
jgi:hypothetical protein